MKAEKFIYIYKQVLILHQQLLHHVCLSGGEEKRKGKRSKIFCTFRELGTSLLL